MGVVDKVVTLLAAIDGADTDAGQRGASLAELVSETGMSRATTHRLASALELHGLLRRTIDGRFALGPRLMTLGQRAGESWPLADAARPALIELRDETQESAQLYTSDYSNDRLGSRVCVMSLESPHGLRTIVSAGSVLPLDQGSGGRVLQGEVAPGQGWLATVAEREQGVASVSAPVKDRSGTVVAAVSISGPIDRFGDDPGARFGDAVVHAADRVARAAGLA